MHRTKVEKRFSRQELTSRAKVIVMDSTPIRFYFRTAEHLLHQAKTYRREGDLQSAYILYMRFCNLVVQELQKHEEFTHPENKASIAALKKSALGAMEEIAKLNPILDKKYEEYRAYVSQRETMIKAQAEDAQQRQLETPHEQGQEEATKKQQDLYWANHPPTQGWSLAKALEGIPGTSSSHLTQNANTNHTSLGTVNEIEYPEHYQRQHPQHHNQHPAPTLSSRTQPPTLAPSGPSPALPKKPATLNNAPKLPPKIPIEEDVHEFSQGLRTLVVPLRLLDRFLTIVRPNTVRNLETCGILAGTLSRNKLTVTTLIIPKQTSTSDTCSTTNEDELFEFQSQRDLMTLGWIHTHPTQTCFMSSVDLHTHCSYQLMLPEAIAIVCAPKHERDYGVFRLTDPPGLQVITNCREKALFHQHPGEDNIYTDACDQGHVQLVDMELDIVDLRKK
ncbi:hypothetical protein B0O80DRAFT_448222 [Mortierella sp. GBAus27b]|nr:hypothetical protein BGX31_006044 [Mortierella sp. GBA43]KAI8355892.1 hypothetical protein B0O80DRAFT_448222 [Mortierella sp. GBAus27b]